MTATVRALHPRDLDLGAVAVPETVRMMRKRRGLTLAELAAGVNKQPAWASRVESGALSLRGMDLVDCAATLIVPPELLTVAVPEADLKGVHFRKYRVPKKVEERATAEANFVSYLVDGLLEKAGQPRRPQFPQIDARGLHEDPREAGMAAARLVREHWGVESGPIRNLAGQLEADGIFIASLPADIARVSAISVWRDPAVAPVTLLTNSISDDTRRFTAAHELAHLVMDAASGDSADTDVEARADAFAGELLAPYDEISGQIRALDLNKFSDVLALHQQWGMHPASFVRRGYLAGDISASAQKRWFQVVNGSRRNMIKSLQSPYQMRPTAIGALLAFLKSHDWTAPLLARELRVHGNELAAVLDGWPFKVGAVPSVRADLHVVPEV